MAMERGSAEFNLALVYDYWWNRADFGKCRCAQRGDYADGGHGGKIARAGLRIRPPVGFKYIGN